MEINNEIYNTKAHSWWNDDNNNDKDGSLVSLRFLSNPAKFSYFKKIIDDTLKKKPGDKTLLDVGCGGGFLSEELAKIDLDVTGIDISKESIEAAKRHAKQENLNIKYLAGIGEDLPFESNSFDFVCCCDVLEHVQDPDKVIGEIARVLKKDGIFFYDTINRTILSKLVMIKIMQEWKSTAFLDSNIHLWNMFIKPKELVKLLEKHTLVNREVRGIAPGMNFIAHYINLRNRQKGKISWQELSGKLKLRVSNNTAGTYVGYAVKNGISPE
ncbi:MAG: 3-demethylubiquinone-9 3-O-methyltransferase [bacterium]|nr:3-demethylubiquinone-9 3-O-methyltransferase [bacterium]